MLLRIADRAGDGDQPAQQHHFDPANAGWDEANTIGAAEEFKAQETVSLEDLYVEDRVTYSVAESGGMKTITKIERLK